jgi:hypothetical protein
LGLLEGDNLSHWATYVNTWNQALTEGDNIKSVPWELE